VIAEQGFEEGTGTRLPHLVSVEREGIQGMEAREIVRSLSRYFEDLGKRIAAKDYKAASALMTPPDTYRSQEREGLSDFDIFASHLEVMNETDPESVFLEIRDRRVVRVVFPEILENPFTVNEGGGWVFPVTIEVRMRGRVLLPLQGEGHDAPKSLLGTAVLFRNPQEMILACTVSLTALSNTGYLYA
jgi:hypothetical protein